MNNKQKDFINNCNYLRTIIFIMFEYMSFLKYEPNEKSKQMNRVKTKCSFVWLFCLFCISQKIRYYWSSAGEIGALKCKRTWRAPIQKFVGNLRKF
jgi:hypothetical protein